MVLPYQPGRDLLTPAFDSIDKGDQLMITMSLRTKLAMSIVALALGFATFTTEHAAAQTDPVADSIKAAEAKAAMEAAADSARKASEARAAGARQTPKPAVSDSGAGQGSAKPAEEAAGAAVKTEQTPGDSAAKSVADTSGKTMTEGEAPDTSASGEQTSAEPPAEEAPPEDPTAPYKNVQFAEGEKPLVAIETSLGKIVVELWPDVAPKHCQNFVYLANKGFYDSLLFHRVVPGFVIQGGDPLGTGMGKPGYTVPAEFSTSVMHEEGVLSMARLSDPDAKGGAQEKPEFLNSAGSQFFICLARTASLDGKYTAFGKVVEGMDVVHKIAKTPAQRERPVTSIYMTKVYQQQKS
jgi:peptidyl-prolyl cis-trans isomerase B (cyclophilin B)